MKAKSGLREFIRQLEFSNPLTRSFYNWRFQKRLMANATEQGRQNHAQVKCGAAVVDIIKENRVIRVSPKHTIYAGAISKEFDLYFSAVKPVEENGCLVVDYSSRKVHRLLDGTEFEFAAFAENSDVIGEYFEWHTPASGETVFDIGSNAGMAAFRLSKLVGPHGKVISFEPDPISLSVLRANIERHKLFNVTVEPSAVSDRDGQAEFFSEGTIGSIMKDFSERDTVGNVVTVPVMSFQRVCQTYGIPAFCKIDIEGAELGLLKGSADFIRGQPINFALDTNHIVGGEYTSKRVEEIFRSAGYVSETKMKSGGMTTYARPGKS